MVMNLLDSTCISPFKIHSGSKLHTQPCETVGISFVLFGRDVISAATPDAAAWAWTGEGGDWFQGCVDQEHHQWNFECHWFEKKHYPVKVRVCHVYANILY